MPPKKCQSIDHLIKAIGYGLDGLKVLTTETAFRHECLYAILCLCLLTMGSATLSDYFIFVILWLMVIAFEAVNTSIEMIVDKISPEISELAKRAKDLASFSVMASLLASMFYVALVLF